MSSSYSANQYDSAFRSQRLQNWGENKSFKERPTVKDGPTTFIANDRGHLLPGVVKRGSAWPDFKGTWDLPARIPARHIDPMGRSVEGLHRLRSWGFHPQRAHTSSRREDKQTMVDQQLDICPSTTAEARPASQTRPVSGGESVARQNQDSEAAVVDKPASLAHKRLTSRCSAAGEETNARPQTGPERPASKVSERAED
nr:protein Flattop [Solea senegalensis]